MRKYLALVLALTMSFALVGCSPTTAGSASGSVAGSAASTEKTPSATDMYEVAICQLVEHAALDAATEGFQDALNEALPGQVNITLQNAQGDIPTASTIINGFVSSEVDLILANATPALQAAVAGTNTIPVLGTSVTEYGVALDIDNFNGTVGGNVSGTSDLAPLQEQAAMLQEWFPDAKNVGLLYCSAEANSQYQVDVIETELLAMGYAVEMYPFSDSNDLAAVVTMAVSESDVIYVPTDNTVASNAGIIDNICRPAGIPVIAGEEGIASGCGVATLAISYYDLGFGTGQMAAKILTGESNIAEMPIEYAPQATKKYNAEICKSLGLTPPEGYVAIAS